MKKLIALLIGVIFIAGCSTPTAYHKVVTVEKDGEGKIVKTTVMEEISQPDLKQEVQQSKHLDQ
ncbi:MAG: hypothetical protein PHO40_01220 [Candidatus Omnitrophica bacterium]|jgi:PBP1b-binding outer membrane lipoprotein LpoB|nr:hypothetical protein [Candidatus Omnitrophota bacterium]